MTFSGDKLLGGIQAGIIVGRRSLIERIRKHPLYRALRVSKLVNAALEATLEAYLAEDALETVPVLRMLALSEGELEIRATEFAKGLSSAIDDVGEVGIEAVTGESVVGGGSAPAFARPTYIVAIKHRRVSSAEIERRLRKAQPPIIARILDDRIIIDLRTVSPAEEPDLRNAVARAA